ncbi:MAG TPA: 2-oxoacid:ferredoxin oxidoreductase subunit beta [Symbiobacteriaceae bacterium]|jgi:2-oxoglutarate ferredoxin oxidoreductase subunit beta
MPTLDSFKVSQKQTWCPGCGDFGVLAALQKAVVNLGIEPHQMVTVSGIGCSGKISQWFGSYGIHTLHGRTLPTATAVKVANKDLTVVAAGGDGDGFGIGVGHFVHTARRNVNITYIVMDNHVYGLTTGQTSPTSDPGMCTKTHPEGAFEEPIHPLELAIISGATFVAQAYSGDQAGVTRILEQAIAHRGFSLVNIFSPCVTFNKLNTAKTFKEGVVDVSADPSYDPANRIMALEKIRETGQMATGVLYKTLRPTYEDLLPSYPAAPLTKVNLQLGRAQFDQIVSEFR